VILMSDRPPLPYDRPCSSSVWEQLPLTVYAIPQFINCPYHGEWDPRAWYDDDEIIKMLEEQGFIDCAICLTEIVGYGYQ